MGNFKHLYFDFKLRSSWMYRKWIPLWQFALHSFPLGLWSWWWLWRQFRWTWLWCVLSGCDLLHVQTFVSKAITFSAKWSFMGSIFNGVMLTESPKVADSILIIWDVAVFHRMISKNKHCMDLNEETFQQLFLNLFRAENLPPWLFPV